MKTSLKGVEAIKRFESFVPKAALCPAGVLSIGYGFTEGVQEGDTMTLAQADAWIIIKLAPYEYAVEQMTNGITTQYQFDALVSLAWNIGIAALRKSTVIRLHNLGDYPSAANAFRLFNKARIDGKLQVVNGLTIRRDKEAATYLTDPEGVQPMPQKIEPEIPVSASGINKAGIIAGGTAAVATVSEMVRTVNDLHASVTGLGTWLIPLLLIVTICAVGYIVWERFQQRNRGQA